MFSYFVSHIPEYLLVFLIFATGVWTLMSTSHVLIKLVIIIGLAGIYFIWAVWHHVTDHKKMTFAVVMEYVSVLALVLWILFSLS